MNIESYALEEWHSPQGDTKTLYASASGSPPPATGNKLLVDGNGRLRITADRAASETMSAAMAKHLNTTVVSGWFRSVRQHLHWHLNTRVVSGCVNGVRLCLLFQMYLLCQWCQVVSSLTDITSTGTSRDQHDDCITGISLIDGTTTGTYF